MGSVERSDMAVELLLEGKVLLLMDGSCIALSAPKVVAEYFYSCDDRYENNSSAYSCALSDTWPRLSP